MSAKTKAAALINGMAVATLMVISLLGSAVVSKSYWDQQTIPIIVHRVWVESFLVERGVPFKVYAQYTRLRFCPTEIVRLLRQTRTGEVAYEWKRVQTSPLHIRREPITRSAPVTIPLEVPPGNYIYEAELTNVCTDWLGKTKKWVLTGPGVTLSVK